MSYEIMSFASCIGVTLYVVFIACANHFLDKCQACADAHRVNQAYADACRVTSGVKRRTKMVEELDH